MDGQWLVLCARLLVAAVFLMAALTKIPRRQGFATDVLNYRLLPPQVARVYAYALPWLELAVATLLLGGILIPVAAGLALLLVVSFLVAVASAMARGLALDCSCFGLLYRERVGWPVLARDGLLALLIVAILLFDSGRFALPTVLSPPYQPADLLALALTLGVLVGSLVVAAPALPRLRRSGQTHPA